MCSIFGGALLLVLIAAHAVSGAPSVEVIERNLANEGVEDAILYGYVIDGGAPSCLSRGDRVFKANDEVAISSNSDMSMSLVYSDSEHTAAEDIATAMKVSGSYGAFSGSASMEVSKSTSKTTKTVRVDSIIKAIKYEVSTKNTFRTFPQNFLTDNFKDAVKRLSVQEIAERIGVFFATKLDLGGEIKKTYVMQASEEDNEMSVKAELKAEYGGACMGVSAEASGSYATRSSNKESQMRISWSAQGGDTTVWLGRTFDEEGTGKNSVGEIQKEWADTITDENLYPANFELRPLWEMVKAVDAAKGAAFETYLKAKWAKEKEQFKPSEFLKPVRQCGNWWSAICEKTHGCQFGCHKNYCWKQCDGNCYPRPFNKPGDCNNCNEWCWLAGNNSQYQWCTSQDHCVAIAANRCAGACGRS